MGGAKSATMVEQSMKGAPTTEVASGAGSVDERLMALARTVSWELDGASAQLSEARRHTDDLRLGGERAEHAGAMLLGSLLLAQRAVQRLAEALERAREAVLVDAEDPAPPDLRNHRDTPTIPPPASISRRSTGDE